MVERLESHQPGKIRIWTGLDRSWLYEIYHFLAANKDTAADEHGVKSMRPPRSHAQPERVALNEGGWFTACLGGEKEWTSNVPQRARHATRNKYEEDGESFPSWPNMPALTGFFPEIQRILRPFSDDVFTEEGRITLFAVALWPGLHSGVFLNRVTGVNWVEWVCSLPGLSNPEVCGVSAGMWHFRSLLLCLVVFPGSRKTTVPESLSPDERE